MPHAPLETVISHWSKLIEGFETSSKDFYTRVELALERRYIPGLKTSRVKWTESGVLSPDREYLRVTGDRLCFDICAAPFGSGFFFSSWMTRKKAQWVPYYLAWFAGLTLFIGFVIQELTTAAWQRSGGLGPGILLGTIRLILNPIVLSPISFLVVLGLIGTLARAGFFGPEDAILTVPGVGWFYGKFFAPETYFRLDSRIMFHTAVHSAMLEAIDGLMATKGLRALSQDERKPVFRELLYDGTASVPSQPRRVGSGSMPPDQAYVSPSLTPDGQTLMAMSQAGAQSRGTV